MYALTAILSGDRPYNRTREGYSHPLCNGQQAIPDEIRTSRIEVHTRWANSGVQ